MNQDKLKQVIAEVLPNVDVVIAQKASFDPLHVEPLFISKPEQIDEVRLSPLCAQNLAGYLPSLKDKKVGVVVKGCDSRTIIQYLQEGLIDREKVTVIGVPCEGVISVRKITQDLLDAPVKEVSFGNGNVTVTTIRGSKSFPLADVAPAKCGTCTYHTPLVYDVLAGDPVDGPPPTRDRYEDIREFEKKSIEERKAYWEETLGRCIRCYACRNACPMCVCQESCIAETREPHWMSQKMGLREKMMFHIIHALHLAGRCTECGECERVCPMGIPLGQLKKKINMDMKDLFDYEPGMKPEDKPPMYTFKVDEEKIEEHELS